MQCRKARENNEVTSHLHDKIHGRSFPPSLYCIVLYVQQNATHSHSLSPSKRQPTRLPRVETRCHPHPPTSTHIHTHPHTHTHIHTHTQRRTASSSSAGRVEFWGTFWSANISSILAASLPTHPSTLLYTTPEYALGLIFPDTVQ